MNFFRIHIKNQFVKVGSRAYNYICSFDWFSIMNSFFKFQIYSLSNKKRQYFKNYFNYKFILSIVRLSFQLFSNIWFLHLAISIRIRVRKQLNSKQLKTVEANSRNKSKASYCKFISKYNFVTFFVRLILLYIDDIRYVTT